MDLEERSYSIQHVHRTASLTPQNLPSPAINFVGNSVRTIPPADYILQINQFSLLLEALEAIPVLFSADKHYASNKFEAGGYKWCLVLYPNGDIKRDANAANYISLYLVLQETNALPVGWEIKVDFKLFIYNQIRDEYLTIQDDEGKLARFSKIHTHNGYSKLIIKADFCDPLNGYLVDDKCSFGVEIFVASNNRIKDECLSSTFQLNQDNSLYTWKLTNFNTNTESSYKSDVFSIAKKNFVLKVCIKEAPSGEKHLVLSLQMIHRQSYFANLGFLRWFRNNNDENYREEGDLWIECNLRVKDQIHGNHKEVKVNTWFHVNSNPLIYQVENFMPLENLADESKGFLLNDTLIIDVEFDRIRQLTTL